ncbi:MAG: CRISPR system precrRNA processing endoribonuclease RAMP protein Cas6 [Aigarchaeota archaeon]|nr:CRISPR system precrRNA processing endoribonuclease RAMP protein Cas6 [Candidatus Pelearchaeum maunauluense]
MAGAVVVRLQVCFTVSKKVVIPPFSAKVSRLILHRVSKLYNRLSNLPKPLKPVSVSPLLHDGIALIKLKGDNRLLTLDVGENYYFSCGMVVNEDFPFDDLLSLESSIVDGVFGASAILRDIRVEVRRFDSFGFEKPRALMLRFISPVLLQLPSFRRFRHGRYVFFPFPSLIIGSLAEHWNSNCDKSLFIKSPSYLSLYSNYVLMESDFRIRPVTVVYDDKRMVRGIMGWVFYDLRKSRNTKSFRRIMALLDYAQYVGMGKSRGTGFGQVNIKCIY